MKSYLSVDLDFWSDYEGDISSTYFFKKVCGLGIPIRVVDSHEKLLKHINSVQADMLYNVDYHSDTFGFANERDRKEWYEENSLPDEGQWGVYVKWRKDACFYWQYPNSLCFMTYGRCWEGDNDNPYKKGVIKEWAKVKRRCGCPKIDWSSVCAIGVATSPDWTNAPGVMKVANLLGVNEDGLDMKTSIKSFWADPEKLLKGLEIPKTPVILEKIQEDM